MEKHIDKDCIFCKLANGEIPTTSIYEDEDFNVIMDLGPASRGHSIILPKTHAANLYELPDDERIFPIVAEAVQHKLKHNCEKTGVKKIRVHDLRHSHVSLLINMGYTALAIGKRVGHSAEKITYRYAHLFPSVQQDMAEQLDAENMEEELNEVEGGLANVG